MRIRTLLATTLMLVVTAQHVSAQTTAASPGTKKDSTVTSRLPSRTTYVRKKSRRSDLPAPPPVPVRPSRRGASPRMAAALGLTGMDTTGRRDQSGKPVGFYATVRGKPTAGPRTSASRNTGASTAPPTNPQKDPYKISR